MGIPVRQLQEQISSSDFAMYRAYNNIDPFENFRFDVNSAVVSQMLAMIHGKKGSRYKLEDFIPEWYEKPKKKVDVKAVANVFDMLVARQNGNK